MRSRRWCAGDWCRRRRPAEWFAFNSNGYFGWDNLSKGDTRVVFAYLVRF
jgi:hypothetical protein